MISQKCEDLLKKAEKLEDKAKRIRHFVGLQESWKEVTDDQRRIFLNNEGMCSTEYNYTFKLKEFGGMGLISYLIKREVIAQFAQRGDQLCERILKYLSDLQSPFTADFLVIENSEIPEKLLSRKMTEKEYFGYLNGDLPIAITNEEAHYLPKQKEKVKE
ncbi:hypothetical protein HYX16_03915 [Candidatus Woesearchaeota archaeon]|nr:hypothetical protein [Candidatus Woesearchaeota archaeon]